MVSGRIGPFSAEGGGEKEEAQGQESHIRSRTCTTSPTTKSVKEGRYEKNNKVFG